MTGVKRSIPWLSFAVSMALTLGAIVFLVLNTGTEGTPRQFGYREMDPLVPLAFATVGLLLMLRVPRNAVGWLFGTIGLIAAVNSFLPGYINYAVYTDPGALPAPTAAAWLHNWLWVPLVGMAAVFLPLLFPDGRVLPAWRRVIWPGAIAIVLASIGTSFEPGELEEYPTVQNPLGASGGMELIVGITAGIGLGLTTVCTFLGAFSQVIRYRRAGTDERHQIKWFAAAIIFAAVTFVLQLLAFAPEAITGEAAISSRITNFLEATLVFAIILLPVTVGVAVLRYRLYDIDILINRTLVYVPLTALLAGLYVALSGLFRTIFTGVTGSGSDAAIAMSTLTIVALLTPAKNQLQSLVDRRFRESPDPMRDLDGLVKEARAVLRVVDSETFYREFLTKAVAAFAASGGYIQINAGDGNSPQRLEVGSLVVEDQLQAPLLSQGIELGFLVLGARLSGRPYTAQDREALARASEMVADVAVLRRQLLSTP